MLKIVYDYNNSLRQLNREWRQSTINKGRHKTSTSYNDRLFDIGKNIDSLTDDEACFYTDQLSSRRGRISEDVDLKYVAKKQTELELKEVAMKRGTTEESLWKLMLNLSVSIFFTNKH